MRISSPRDFWHRGLKDKISHNLLTLLQQYALYGVGGGGGGGLIEVKNKTNSSEKSGKSGKSNSIKNISNKQSNFLQGNVKCTQFYPRK